MYGNKRNFMQEGLLVLANSKIAIAALALALSCAPAFAQGDASSDPPDAPGSVGPGRMHRGGPGRDGGWARGDDGRGWGRRDGDGNGFGHGRGMRMRGRQGMKGSGFMLGRVLSDPTIREHLGVSADQAAKIRQQEADFRKTEIRNRADLEIKRIDLREMMGADKPDRAAIDAKLQEISTSRLAFEKSAVNFRLNSRDALTPEQRQKLRDLVRNRRDRDSGSGERGSHGGRPGGRRGAAPPANQSGPPPAPTGL
jgi:Spy/CpxP family protein refolding chaperone